MIYHVSQNQNTIVHDGSVAKTLTTISKAAQLAQPGDTVCVHEGVYREEVAPKNSGTQENPIVYKSAQGEKVIISGAEIVKDWIKLDNGLYKATVPNTIFGEFNPYTEEIFGDWFKNNGRVQHRGEVFMDDTSLYEMPSIDYALDPVSNVPAQKADKYYDYWEYRSDPTKIKTWYCQSDDQNTYIYVNLKGANPNNHTMEISVRQTCFFPKEHYINYITVSGFEITKAATQWAPPTAFQSGIIGPNWSKGWIIENNIITHSKCSAISLGNSNQNGDNDWSRNNRKKGAQTQRETVFSALRHNWDKEHVGSHIVRNNIIHDCGQAGVVGHLGCIYSLIENNRIYDIHTKRLFNGWEIGGIKLHAAIDTIIRKNVIYNTYRGIWMDWQAQGVRISQNAIWDNDYLDIFIEVSHGPALIDNNILLSDVSFRSLAQGTAFVHNLAAGSVDVIQVLQRYTPYHYPHETDIMGIVTITNGDDRFYNNLFIGSPKRNVGLHNYYNFPTPEDYEKKVISVDPNNDFSFQRFPVEADGNIYYNDAKPFYTENKAFVQNHMKAELHTKKTDNGLTFKLKLENQKIETKPVTTTLLGKTVQSEQKFDNPDGTVLIVDTDYFGKHRDISNPCPGPFARLWNQDKIEIEL